jgi:hypothetical protein
MTEAFRWNQFSRLIDSCQILPPHLTTMIGAWKRNWEAAPDQARTEADQNSYYYLLSSQLLWGWEQHGCCSWSFMGAEVTAVSVGPISWRHQELLVNQPHLYLSSSCHHDSLDCFGYRIAAQRDSRPAQTPRRDFIPATDCCNCHSHHSSLGFWLGSLFHHDSFKWTPYYPTFKHFSHAHRCLQSSRQGVLHPPMTTGVGKHNKPLQIA